MAVGHTTRMFAKGAGLPYLFWRKKLKEVGVSEWRWSGPNPIERAAISIDFATPFTPATIRDAAAKHRVLKEVLPRRMNQQAMVFQVGQTAGPIPVPMPMLQTPQSSGFAFDKTDEIGRQVKAVNMFGTSIVYSSALYSRWDEVWLEANRVFGELIPIVDASGNLPLMTTLEYVNQFFWSGEPASADISSLLLEGPFVCPNVFRVSGFWHSFHGFFRDAEGPVTGRHLENINLTVSDRPDPTDDTEETRRCMEIVVNQRFIFAMPASFASPEKAPTSGTLDIGAHVILMHERNKDILREILQDSIINRIPSLGVS